MISGSLSLMILLSTYFILTYVIDSDILKKQLLSVEDLHSVYYRNGCFSATLNLAEEDFMAN